MKVVALVLAGGIGSRVGKAIPKQYIEISNKPLLMYTLENLEKSKFVDEINIVCSNEWTEYIKNKCKEYGLSKVKNTFEGGKTGLESIWNGFKGIKNALKNDDIIIIQDGNRVNTSDIILEDGIQVCQENDMSISVLKQIHAEIEIDKEGNQSLLDREKLFELQRPEFFKFKKLLEIYELSKKREFNSLSPSTIMIENDEQIYFCKGDNLNIKITYLSDIEIFKALLSLNKD